MRILLAICLFAAGFFSTTDINGQRQPVIAALPLIGDSVKAGKTLTVQDTVYLNPSLQASIAETKSLDNIVSLYMDEFSTNLIPDTFHVTVRIQINYVTASGSTGNRLDTFSINYSKNYTYNNKAIKFYQDYYSLQVQILDVSITGAAADSVRPLLVMENMISIARTYTTDCSAITSVSSSDSSVATGGELSVAWPGIAFIPSYDLEWTYIDKSALDSGNYDLNGQLSPELIFRNNSSRLTLAKNSYRIPLLYDGDGSLFFRVRTLQNAPDGEVIAGSWSSESGSNGLGRYDFTGHQRNLNWQATTSFAEEGKRKSVVQYFDGSLKGRQTVTKDNTTKTTIVAETLYDKQGRPVIQVLPSPTLNKLIAYTPLFNVRGINSAEYDKSVYDTLFNANDYCATGSDSMSSTSGSSQYYSSLNPMASIPGDYHKYVPNAGGYPFTETRYTRDNTGRVDRQGGVGPNFQLTDSGHYTKYFYASPDQKELDALFGTEAADASHFEKNMVRDANGQYSVSYADMHGRTVATALAGDAPSSLDQLASYDSITQTDQLLTPVNNVIKDNSIQATRSIVVPKGGNYILHYSVSPESLSLEDCKDSTICYDCLYDLTITINDNCSNDQFGGNPKTINLRNFSLFKSDSITYNLDTTCAAANAIDTSFTVFLEEGSYDITKVLSVTKDGMQYYRDSIFLAHNTCKSYSQFVLEQLDSIRQRLDCTPDSATTNLVTASRDQMLADLTPSSGQYTDTSSMPPRSTFSIFNKVSGKYLYQTVYGYKDEDGNDDAIRHFNPITSVWEMLAPQNLSPEEFILNFKDSWAERLLSLHPEYRLLQEYDKLKSAYNWESDFLYTNTFAEALSKGFLNPTGSTSSPASNFTVTGKTDSLFVALGVSDPSIVSTAKQAIDNLIFNYLRNNPNTTPAQYYTLWGLATGIVKCNDTLKACFDHWNLAANTFNTDSLCTGDLDQAWRLFRSQYLKVREDWIDNYTRSRSGVYASQIQAPCYPVFPDRNIASYLTGTGYQGYNGTIQDTAAGHSNLDSFLFDNCKAYAQKWWQDLAPCGYTSTDSLAIIPLLIQVAYAGADKSHPFGSSTVKPSSTNSDRSFEQVINDYNLVHYPSMDPLTCNSYLIPYPKPYDQPGLITNLPIITAPDSCSCSRINELYSNYINEQPTYQTFSNYMWLAQGTHISEGTLDTLRNLCNTSSSCTYLEKPILLPPALQCGIGDICISCTTVRSVYDSFAVKFPGVIPIADETDTLQQQKNRLFANFMNSHLGFSKTTQDFLNFIALCDSINPVPSLTCDSLEQLREEYLKVREEISSGTAAGGYRLTPVKDEIIEMMNGLLEMGQGKYLDNTMSPRYGYVSFNNTTTNKLFSFSKRPDGDGRFSGIAPINAKYVLFQYPTHPDNDSIQSFTNAISVSSDDFAGVSNPGDLSKKYYATTMATNTYGDTSLFYIWGGTYYAWRGERGSSFLPDWYAAIAPLAKYLSARPTDTVQYNCDDYRIHLYHKLPSITSYAEYTNHISLGTSRYINPEIKKVISYSFDTTLLRLYRNLGTSNPYLAIDGTLMKARLLLADNSEQDAWLKIETCTNVNYIYKEPVDTNIYNADCQKGFAAYYNSKKGSSYTFGQIDSIYQVTCGKTLDVCTISSCDSSAWTVFNPGTDLQAGEDMYANAHNNISSDSLFHTGNFNSPTQGQAGQYVLINKQDSIAVGSAAVLMKWRVKFDSVSSMVNPFIQRGNNTYYGSQWTKDPTDSTWWIGTTATNGTDGSIIKGIGLESNSHSLKTDWVKLIKSSNDSVLYFEDFSFTQGQCPDTASEILLCGKQAADSTIILNMDPCADTSLLAIEGATYLYDIYRRNLKAEFENAYSRKCLDAGKLESFTVTHKLTEYHYTLYYYDQAGNLVKTVPPEGVHSIRRTTWLDSVNAARVLGQVLTPTHTLATTYRYNSLNQVITQHSPDGGLSKFWYDRLGRLVVSQNAKQISDSNYSYTLYDLLGRITEVGQKKQTTSLTDATARNRESLSTWLNYTYSLNGTTVIAEQVTKTVYDERDPETGAFPSDYVVNSFFQKAYTLRNRVSYTRYFDKLTWNGLAVVYYPGYDNSTTYSYDIHGNVDTLVHDYTVGLMEENANRFKAIAYKYDLISGKVNEVHYQPGMKDQFYHRYEYDAENRLTDAYTTDRKPLLGIPVLEEHEARYNYYKHGPLARAVIGQQQVQGTDYAYTVQGWLKGVNSDSLLDGDGVTGSMVAKDAYRFSLNYFNGDYHAVGASVGNVFPGHTAYMGANAGDYKPLYNGNISSMIVGVPKLGETKLYNYGYDQLNRIVRMDSWKGYNAGSMSWSGITKTDEYKERVSYDGNGNILKYLRNGNAGQLSMDSLNYAYNRNGSGNLTDNRLRHVKDAISDGNYAEDIDNQSDDNYEYDAIGNLIKDTKEGITSIDWTVYGKIKKITKSNGTVISYTYDVAGNRISKTVIPPSGGGGAVTWYTRDAQGNTLAIYTGTASALTLSEQHIYGSSRLGVWNRSINMTSAPGSNNYIFARGNKFFELSNHLGNVLVTVSDKKQGVDTDSDGDIDFYVSDVVTANDYYPFGMGMPGRIYTAGSLYRYGFNGQERSPNLSTGNYDFGARIYDGRIGRFLSTDKMNNDYETPFGFAGNSPINMVDFDGYFKISSFFIKKYPTLAKVLEIILPQLKSDGGMMELWIKNIGFDNHDAGVSAWNEMLTFGTGPWLTPNRPWEEFKNRNSNPNDPLSAFFGEAESGQYVKGYPNNITVGYLVFDRIEAALKKGDGKEMSQNIFVAMMKVMHEAGHWARHMKANLQSRSACNEDGSMAEEAVTGGVRFSNTDCHNSSFLARDFDSGKAIEYYNSEFDKTFGKQGLPSRSGVWIPKIGLCIATGSFKKNIPSGQTGDPAVIDNDDKEPKIPMPDPDKKKTGKFSWE